MARKQIDCYGFEAASEFFGIKKLQSYLVKKTDDGTVYTCFREEPKRPVHRIDVAPETLGTDPKLPAGLSFGLLGVVHLGVYQ